MCSVPDSELPRLSFLLLSLPSRRWSVAAAPTTPRARRRRPPSSLGERQDDRPVCEDSGAKPTKLVIAPAAAVLRRRANRYPFGVFTAGNEQVERRRRRALLRQDAKGPVQGPLPAGSARWKPSPPTAPQAAEGPGEAKTVYVVPKVDFDRNGSLAGGRDAEGAGGLEASRVPSPVVGVDPRMPAVGEKPPGIHTPTAADVGGDLAKIDTRVPPDQMHEVDFADVARQEADRPRLRHPRALPEPGLRAGRRHRPAGRRRVQGDADFIHMEVYNDNDPNKGIRPQLEAFGLRTEPWTFLIERRRARQGPHRGCLWRVRTGKGDAVDSAWLNSQLSSKS